jgi:zinc protease
LVPNPLDKGSSFLTFAIYAPQNRDKLEIAFKEEIARALKDGFTAEEITAAKSGYLQGQQVTRAQDASLARTLATDLYIKRTLAWDADFEKKVGALTPEEIAAALRKHFDVSKMSIFKAGDFAKAAK